MATITLVPACVELVKRFEGFSAAPYLDPVGIPTVGYGSTWRRDGTRVQVTDPPITEEEAEFLLLRELWHSARGVLRWTKVELRPNELGALTSFTYNLGVGAFQRSTLRQKLNRGDRFGAAAELLRWTRAGGRVLAGLVKRRRAERELFLS